VGKDIPEPAGPKSFFKALKDLGGVNGLAGLLADSLE
jgi:hypothetical protein